MTTLLYEIKLQHQLWPVETLYVVAGEDISLDTVLLNARLSFKKRVEGSEFSDSEPEVHASLVSVNVLGKAEVVG